MKRVIYYQRDKQNHPRVTVCLMKNDEGIISRGLALCSLKENPNKKRGTDIAVGKALQAFEKNITGFEINRDEAYEVLNSVSEHYWYYKSYYDTVPVSKLEKKLIGRL